MVVLFDALIVSFYFEGLFYWPSPTGAYTASKHGVVGYSRAFAKVCILYSSLKLG